MPVKIGDVITLIQHMQVGKRNYQVCGFKRERERDLKAFLMSLNSSTVPALS